MVKKITKKERQNMFSSLLIAGGIWLTISPLKDAIISNYGGKVSIFIGIILIIFALWRFDVI